LINGKILEKGPGNAGFHEDRMDHHTQKILDGNGNGVNQRTIGIVYAISNVIINYSPRRVPCSQIFRTPFLATARYSSLKG
jgi:hypothetical protein